MAKDTIRVGFIGAGGNTRSRHIPGLKAQAGIELAAVANRSVASGRKIAREFGSRKSARIGRKFWTTTASMRSASELGLYMHETLTVASLEAGKHVMCEARMAMNSAEGHRMLAASRRHPRLTAQIVPSPMTLPFDQTIIAMISGGFIGELIALDARIAAGSDFPIRMRRFIGVTTGRCPGIILCRWVFGTKA